MGLLFALALPTLPVAAFSTISLARQQAEHEQVTPAALANDPYPRKITAVVNMVANDLTENERRTGVWSRTFGTASFEAHKRGQCSYHYGGCEYDLDSAKASIQYMTGQGCTQKTAPLPWEIPFDGPWRGKNQPSLTIDFRDAGSGTARNVTFVFNGVADVDLDGCSGDRVTAVFAGGGPQPGPKWTPGQTGMGIAVTSSDAHGTATLSFSDAPTSAAGPPPVITSPRDGSVIALTDGNYIGAWIDTTTAKPDPRFRLVKVSGTGGSDLIDVNGSGSAFVVDPAKRTFPRGPHDKPWNAYVKIPADQTGPLTITAKNSGGLVASTITVTLIALRITTPAEKAVVPLTDTPGMPPLNAAVEVAGYSGATAGVAFNWTLDVRGQRVTRVPPAQTGTWNPYTEQVATGITRGAETWRPTYRRIVGGFGHLLVEATLPGVLDNPVKSDPRWFDMPGTNPRAETAKAYVDAHERTYGFYLRHLFCHESNWRQFNGAANRNEPPTGNVPLSPNPAPGRPLFGPPAGIGTAQLDPADFPDQQWNWQANVLRGIRLFDDTKVTNAQGWARREQAALTAKRAAVLARANQNRDQRRMPHITIAAVNVPQLTADQIGRDAIRQYNGGHQFHFDADFVLNHDGVTVGQTGQLRWVDTPAGRWTGRIDPGQPGSPAYESWLTHAAQWTALANPGYVQAVLSCRNS